MIRGAIEDDHERYVTAGDVALVAEIAEASLRADQQERKPIYAASGIPTFWIINLVDRQLDVRSNPEGREYRTSQVFSREQDVPLIRAGQELGRIRAADLNRSMKRGKRPKASPDGAGSYKGRILGVFL